MLKWLCEQLMGVEVTAKINALKFKRNPQRAGYRLDDRVRRFNTHMGTMCLFVLKLHNGGYVPFIVTEKCLGGRQKRWRVRHSNRSIRTANPPNISGINRSE